MQKNIITNEFEVIKKYNIAIPRNIFAKDAKEILQIINQGEELKASEIIAKLLRGRHTQEFLQNCSNVVYKTKILWEAIRKAEEIRNLYYKNYAQSYKFKKCLHREPAIAPKCLLKEEFINKNEVIKN